MKMIPCPTCGEELEDNGSLAGRLVRCPNCSTEFRMPGNSAARSPEPVDRPYASPQAPAWDAQRVPAKLQIVQILMLIGGAVALTVAAGWAAIIVGLLWPGTYYSLVVGIVALIRGVRLLTAYDSPPKGTAIMQILNIVNGDFINLGLGIAEIVLMNDPEVQAYFERRR